MGPNRVVSFKLERFEEIKSRGRLPHGTLLELGVNPYNGKVVISFNDTQVNSSAVIESVIDQLSRDLHRMKMQEHGVTFSDYADFLDGKRMQRIAPVMASIRKQEEKSVRAS